MTDLAVPRSPNDAAPVAVLGAGAWGTALSSCLAERGEMVRLWSWEEVHVAELRAERENRRFFPGFPLHERVEPTADLSHALSTAKFAIVVVPTPGVRQLLERAKAHLADETLLFVASKGIETGSLLLLTEVIEAVIGESARARSVVLSGPSFAEEVARGLPTSLVAAAAHGPAATRAQEWIATERLRIYTSDDPVGVQVGGALKNVIAIAAGAVDGLNFGHNTRAALITRGLAEIARLGVAKGGHPLTLSGLAGLGDLVLTCSADLSRNRTVGLELGRGRTLEDVLGSLNHVAEGVTTAKSAYFLARQLGVELPITNTVYRVLYENQPVADAVRGLLARPPRKERDSG
jgi:glycerol-3-phosphate dehydrogenase (NAD(P)+)